MIVCLLISDECLILISWSSFVNFAVFISGSVWFVDEIEILGSSYYM